VAVADVEAPHHGGGLPAQHPVGRSHNHLQQQQQQQQQQQALQNVET
jgi:hypothetical protein